MGEMDHDLPTRPRRTLRIVLITGVLILGLTMLIGTLALIPLRVRQEARAAVEKFEGEIWELQDGDSSWYWDRVEEKGGIESRRIGELSFWGGKVTAEDLSFLPWLYELQELELYYIDVSDEFLAKVVRNLEAPVQIEFMGTLAGDKTAQAVLDHDNPSELRTVNFNHCYVSPEMRDKLAAKFPAGSQTEFYWSLPPSGKLREQVRALWPVAEIYEYNRDLLTFKPTLTLRVDQVESWHLAILSEMEGFLSDVKFYRGSVTADIGSAVLRGKQIRNMAFHDADLQELGWLREVEGLEFLEIQDCTVHLPPIESGPLLPESLERVWLPNLAGFVGQGGVGRLLQGSQVRRLDFDDDKRRSPVLDEHLEGLRGLPLEELILNGHPLTDRGMNALGTLTELRDLYLDSSMVTGDGIRELEDLKKLESLHLRGTAIGDDDLSGLGSLRSLKLLILDQTKIGDEGLAHLAGRLPNLEKLSLEKTRVSSKSVPILLSFPKLRRLDLKETNFTAMELAELEAKRPEWFKHWYDDE